MRRRFLFLPLVLGLWPLLNGCAKSPAGVTPLNVNRFETQLSLYGTLNPNYYYAVAFDDSGANSAGPVALNGNTQFLNGVMGGTFRLLVLYHGSVFSVFYRSNPSDPSTEQQIDGSNVFNTGQYPRATQNGLDFSINLDAQLPNSSTYIFPRQNSASTQIAASSLSINVACTNAVIIAGASNDPGIKPVDSLGNATLSTPVEVQINATTRATSIYDPQNDINQSVAQTFLTLSSPDYVDFSTIDLSGLQIYITRTSS